jgi:hypothetical protein
MKTFTIENETHHITIHNSAKAAEAVPNSERFGSEAQLAKLAAHWPASRPVEIWNSLPGETPARKFQDRTTAISRIWKAIQSLGRAPSAAVDEPAAIPENAPETVPVSERIEKAQPEAAIPNSPDLAPATPVAPHPPDVAPEAAPAKRKATREKKERQTAAHPGTPREGSKTSQAIAILKREGGATLEEIMAAMGWQSHTTRAMMSAGGSLAKKHGLVISSQKVGDKRTYSIKA